MVKQINMRSLECGELYFSLVNFTTSTIEVVCISMLRLSILEKMRCSINFTSFTTIFF